MKILTILVNNYQNELLEIDKELKKIIWFIRLRLMLKLACCTIVLW